MSFFGKIKNAIFGNKAEAAPAAPGQGHKGYRQRWQDQRMAGHPVDHLHRQMTRPDDCRHG